MILAVHGFLGQGSDWNFLREAGFEVIAPDLFADRQRVAGWFGGLAPPPDVIVGYSMGGRLALQVASRFKLAVIISAGITPPDPGRRARDDAWAARFESEEWSTLMRDWNAKEIFSGHDAHRQEKDYDRAALAAALREWSPSVLHAPDLRKLETPVIWMAGDRDEKYVAEAERAVALLPHARLEVVSGAGHRVPFERPDAVVDLLRDALRQR